MKKKNSVIATLLTVCTTVCCTVSAFAVPASALYLQSEDVYFRFVDNSWTCDSGYSGWRDLKPAAEKYKSEFEYICTARAQYEDNLWTDKIRCGISSTQGCKRYAYDVTHNVWGPTLDGYGVGSFTPWCDYYSDSKVYYRGYVNLK